MLSTQASQIAANQHPLNQLTSITEELVKALQGLHSSNGPTTTTTPTLSAITHAAVTPSPVSPRLSFLERFYGDPTKCKGFTLQCSLFLTQQPTLYPTEASRIAFVFSLLTGKVFEWITAVWRDEGSAFPTYDSFMQRFSKVFDHPHEGKGESDRLLELTQGRRTVAKYAITFCTIAVQTRWVSDTLKTLVSKGLVTRTTD